MPPTEKTTAGIKSSLKADSIPVPESYFDSVVSLFKLYKGKAETNFSSVGWGEPTPGPVVSVISSCANESLQGERH